MLINYHLKLQKIINILFLLEQKRTVVNDNIILDNIGIKQVEVTKFLGVLVDQHLSWKQYISHITKRISKTFGMIRNLVSSFLQNLY